MESIFYARGGNLKLQFNIHTSNCVVSFQKAGVHRMNNLKYIKIEVFIHKSKKVLTLIKI